MYVMLAMQPKYCAIAFDHIAKLESSAPFVVCSVYGTCNLNGWANIETQQEQYGFSLFFTAAPGNSRLMNAATNLEFWKM